MLRLLDRHGVQYVVIGGVASRAHGDPSVTFDLDITPDPSEDNLGRLAAALEEMDALVRPPDADPVRIPFDARMIGRFSTLATRTPLGDLDVVVRPDGVPGGYEQLAANAVVDRAFGMTIAVAGVEDLVASRRASAEITGQDRYRQLADRLEALGSHRESAAPVKADPLAERRAQRLEELRATRARLEAQRDAVDTLAAGGDARRRAFDVAIARVDEQLVDVERQAGEVGSQRASDDVRRVVECSFPRRPSAAVDPQHADVSGPRAQGPRAGRGPDVER